MTRRRASALARRVWFWGTVATLAVATVSSFVLVVSARRADAVDRTAVRARAAVDRARAAGARTWATDELAEAERLAREALIVRRRQDVRWWIPDYAEAERAFEASEAEAGKAARLADIRRVDAVRAAEAAIAAAGEAIGRSTSLSATIYAGAAPMRLLSRARVRLHEARIYQREGDYTEAAASADQAYALTRRMDEHTTAVVARYADPQLVRTWQRLKQETIAWSRQQRRPAVLVSKEEHRVTLYLDGEVHRVYEADLGFNWVADKRHAGDGATPEGRYRVIQEKRGGATLYYKALLLDYPNALDRREFAAGRRGGEIPASADIGGLIEIHGEGGRGEDWTKGCVALRNRDMDELMRLVGNGTPVTIIGSEGTGALAALAAGEGRPGRSGVPR
jgi:lipoprotein-anchoring transpeptidase ErfK/SrfK